MKIGPWPENKPLGNEPDRRIQNSEKSNNQGSKKDQIEVSDKARTDVKPAVDDVVLSRKEPEKVGYDRKEIERRYTDRSDYQGIDSSHNANNADVDRSLSGDRIERIQQRFRSGFYDQQNIRDIIAEKLADELRNTSVVEEEQ